MSSTCWPPAGVRLALVCMVSGSNEMLSIAIACLAASVKLGGERHNGIVVAFEISFAERVGLHYLSELLRRDFRATHLSETSQK